MERVDKEGQIETVAYCHCKSILARVLRPPSITWVTCGCVIDQELSRISLWTHYFGGGSSIVHQCLFEAKIGLLHSRPVATIWTNKTVD